jgi:hypothetical protein
MLDPAGWPVPTRRPARRWTWPGASPGRPGGGAAGLQVYRVLLRDRAAIAELVDGVLRPLEQARGGPAPLLDTLEAYFASGGVAAETAPGSIHHQLVERPAVLMPADDDQAVAGAQGL